jgi:hypothetical protein
MNLSNFYAMILTSFLTISRLIIYSSEKKILTGGTMTETKYEDQNSGHMSWMQWINVSMDNAIEFYKEVKLNFRQISGQFSLE